VARPLRSLYPPRVVRRRHRTWMVAMSLATAAMVVWGLTLLMLRFAPEYAPPGRWAFWASSLFAVPGLALGLLTIRAKRSWFLVALVPIWANAMLLVLPWLALHLRSGN
jgi:hypothetical protein